MIKTIVIVSVHSLYYLAIRVSNACTRISSEKWASASFNTAGRLSIAAFELEVSFCFFKATRAKVSRASESNQDIPHSGHAHRSSTEFRHHLGGFLMSCKTVKQEQEQHSLNNVPAILHLGPNNRHNDYGLATAWATEISGFD